MITTKQNIFSKKKKQSAKKKKGLFNEFQFPMQLIHTFS